LFIDNNTDLNKTIYGQYFTTSNPFDHRLFYLWRSLISDFDKKILIEPFSGANNIIKMISSIGIQNEWKCYDIHPDIENNKTKYEIEQRDTLAFYPEGFDVAITNPPYLAKNSAKRRKLHDLIDFKSYDDLYKVALEKMLENNKYVCAIIPASYVQSNLFTDRLLGVVLLECKMFSDTDCPVCLVLYIPTEQKVDIVKKIEIDGNTISSKDDYFVFVNDSFKGARNYILSCIPEGSKEYKIKFNDIEGTIGLRCVDNNKERSIKFVKKEEIKKSSIKVSSRNLTIISGIPDDIDMDELIFEANSIIKKIREETSDVFLTTFKGLRADGYYRRRITFVQAKIILCLAIEKIKNKRL